MRMHIYMLRAGAAAAGVDLILLYSLRINQRAKGTQRRVPVAAMSEARRQERPGPKTGRTLTGTRQGVRHDLVGPTS